MQQLDSQIQKLNQTANSGHLHHIVVLILALCKKALQFKFWLDFQVHLFFHQGPDLSYLFLAPNMIVKKYLILHLFVNLKH